MNLGGAKHKTFEESFWSKIDKKGVDDCWEWQASRNKDGYGHLMVNGKLTRANRLAWMLIHGGIPTGMNVCHKCDNPPCCNPSHLFIGSHTDNMVDCAQKGRKPATLSKPDVLVIKRAYFSGEMSQAELSRKFAVSRNIIYRIVTGETWRWVEVELENTYYRPRKTITKEQIFNIRQMISSGKMTNREIASICGVSESYISLVKSGKLRRQIA